MISTLIFVYLLLKWGLLGDMLINAYYFIMSVYGWYIWTRKVDDAHVTPISRMTSKEHKISIGIFIKSDFHGQGIASQAINILMKKHPRSRYLANVNPKNKKSIQFFKNQKFNLIQHTYELKK